MVTPTLLALAVALASALGPAPADPPGSEAEPSRAVGSALGKGSYPWYDPATDRARPIVLPGEMKPLPRIAGLAWLGNAVALLVFAAGLAALVGIMIWFWRIQAPDGPTAAARATAPGEPTRVEALPPGMLGDLGSADPWEEALRRRDRGDLAGAVVCLFAHQLLTLSGLGLVRLAPGRTGRQLLRSVADAEFRGLAQPTLRLFEAVYYGHRTPSPGEFAAVWERAEAFERRVAGGVVA